MFIEKSIKNAITSIELTDISIICLFDVKIVQAGV